MFGKKPEGGPTKPVKKEKPVVKQEQEENLTPIGDQQESKRIDPPMSEEALQPKEQNLEVATVKDKEITQLDPAPKPVEKTEAKPVKSMDDDGGLLDQEEEEEAGDAEDSMTSLRLQRARNRIWLDLRDGIDLKALARMKSEEAREEVYRQRMW